MYVFFIFGLLFFILASYWSSAQAAFHDYGVPTGQRTLSYFLMQQLTYSYQSSAINFDLGIDESRSLEIYLMGYRTAYILSDSTYQLGALGKQKAMEVGNLSFTGVLGVGGLYAPSAQRFSGCANVGGILGFNLFPELKITAPALIASVFSDGVLLDYSAGVSFKPPALKGKEIILGGKGNLMVISTSSFMGIQNSFYGLVGLRITL